MAVKEVPAPPKIQAADVLRRALAAMGERLPVGWDVEVSYESGSGGGSRPDARVELKAPSGSRVQLVLEYKRGLVVRDLPSVLAQAADRQVSAELPSQPVVVAPYLSSSVREWLERNQVSYLDATGNVFVVSRDPALFLRDRGADRDPWRGPGRPRGTLQGEPAARVVRALADFRPPLRVTELVSRSGASTGATYRVLEYLEQEALVVRGARGLIDQVRWRDMLERWSQDYGFQRDNAVARYLQPRGLPALQSALEQAPGLRYVVTGSLAASLWAPYAPPRLAMVYVDDVPSAAGTLGLRLVDSGANVLLAAPGSEVVFDRPVISKRVTYAAPSQVAVDLLTGPGRSAAEAQALLEWMEANERAWRA